MPALPTEPVEITEPRSGRGRNDLRRNLVGLSREELKDTMVEAGLEPFRARQVWQWIYWHGVSDFGLMSNIAKKARETLAERFVIERPEIVTEQRSVDGTRKWLLRFADGNEAETVNIPEEDRGSVCVSSQVGCTLTCSFCHTGTQPLVRNLSPAEIVGQFMVARDSYGEWPTPIETTRMLSNIVMMGMGEPLYNFDNVATALRIVMDEQGIALSRRRITLSTSGVVPMIPKVGEALDVNLAVSLHAVNDEVRDTLVPINRKWPIKELLKACADVVRTNKFAECYIRPLVFFGEGEMGLSARGNKIRVSIAAWPWGAYLGQDGVDKGVRLKTSSFVRFHHNSMMPAAKAMLYAVSVHCSDARPT